MGFVRNWPLGAVVLMVAFLTGCDHRDEVAALIQAKYPELAEGGGFRFISCVEERETRWHSRIYRFRGYVRWDAPFYSIVDVHPPREGLPEIVTVRAYDPFPPICPGFPGHRGVTFTATLHKGDADVADDAVVNLPTDVTFFGEKALKARYHDSVIIRADIPSQVMSSTSPLARSSSRSPRVRLGVPFWSREAQAQQRAKEKPQQSSPSPFLQGEITAEAWSRALADVTTTCTSLRERDKACRDELFERVKTVEGESWKGLNDDQLQAYVSRLSSAFDEVRKISDDCHAMTSNLHYYTSFPIESMRSAALSEQANAIAKIGDFWDRWRNLLRLRSSDVGREMQYRAQKGVTFMRGVETQTVEQKKPSVIKYQPKAQVQTGGRRTRPMTIQMPRQAK